MQIEQLIELVYWMLIVFGVLFGIALIIALVVIIKGWSTFKREIFLNGEEVTKPVYKYKDPTKKIDVMRITIEGRPKLLAELRDKIKELNSEMTRIKKRYEDSEINKVYFDNLMSSKQAQWRELNKQYEDILNTPTE